MRFVVFGAGAVGGVVGARLHQAGHELILNLGNAVSALCAKDDRRTELTERARAEGRARSGGPLGEDRGGGDRRPLPGRFLELSVDDVMAVAV
jgi:hypothetical protein